MKVGLVRKEKHGPRMHYFPTGAEYKLSTHKKHSLPKASDIEDRLLKAALDIQLTTEQKKYLKAHKKEKRTVLARKLGISKLQLNFMLCRLG